MVKRFVDKLGHVGLIGEVIIVAARLEDVAVFIEEHGKKGQTDVHILRPGPLVIWLKRHGRGHYPLHHALTIIFETGFREMQHQSEDDDQHDRHDGHHDDHKPDSKLPDHFHV